MSVIKYSFWLRFSRSKALPHISKGPPAMTSDERAMRCEVELPVSLFTRPQLIASIKVNEVPTEPINIDIEAAETALSEVLGADVVFTVLPPRSEEPR